MYVILKISIVIIWHQGRPIAVVTLRHILIATDGVKNRINPSINQFEKKNPYLVVFQCLSSLYSRGHCIYWHVTLKISFSELGACLNIYFHIYRYDVSKTNVVEAKIDISSIITSTYHFIVCTVYWPYLFYTMLVLYFSDGFMFRKQTNVIVVTSLTTGQQ